MINVNDFFLPKKVKEAKRQHTAVTVKACKTISESANISMSNFTSHIEKAEKENG